MADHTNQREIVFVRRVNALIIFSMKLPKLTAVIEKEGKWYVATCPELGVASQGRSFEEAEVMIREAVELLLEEADEAEIKRRLNRGVKVKRLELAHA